MKLSASYLLRVAELNLAIETLCEQLTLLGLEVESCQAVAPPFTHVVVGEVLQALPHPNADRLRVCEVNVGSKILHIVCGAPNARAGIKVAVAMLGAVLPGDFVIKAAKLRGVDSEGMLCSEAELGLPATQEGIIELPQLAPLGEDLRHYLALDDYILDINITPNRADCLSVFGIARELALKNTQNLNLAEARVVPAVTGSQVELSIDVPEAAPLYCVRVIQGVDNTIPTPPHILTQLMRSGLRSISPIVDILNYVMLLEGQPMHAFDLSSLEGGLRLRFAHEDEKITLLNEQELSLRPETLVIADAKKALALAGIMGAKNSECQRGSQNVLLESAFFAPKCMAGMARSYHLATDASHRFERGVDPERVVPALERATALIIEICGGTPGPIVQSVHQAGLPSPAKITLAYAAVEKLLGLAVPAAEIESILQGVGCSIAAKNATELSVLTPSWRFDLNIPEDLIEEIARIKGYDAFPSKIPVLPVQAGRHKEAELCLDKLKDFLCAQGLQEVLSFSFVDPGLQQHFVANNIKPARLSNPISSDLAEMRVSLLPSLIKILQYNERRQQQEVRIFELGKTYVDVGAAYQETLMLAGVLTGARIPKHWQEQAAFDFYDLKGIIERLLSFSLGAESSYSQHKLPKWLHPGQGVCVNLQGEQIGYFGALHPELQILLELKQPVFIFELKADYLRTKRVPKAKDVSKYPTLRRDLALLIPEEKPAQEVLALIQENSAGMVLESFIFDVYQGEHLPSGYKSLAIALILQAAERTLTDKEVEACLAGLISKLQAAGISLRS